LQTNKFPYLKVIVQPKIKMLSLLTHPEVAQLNAEGKNDYYSVFCAGPETS